MKHRRYTPMPVAPGFDRREFVTSCSVAAGGIVLGGRTLFGQGQTQAPPLETNFAELLKVPKTKTSVPGPFPGKVVKVTDPRSLVADKFDGKVIDAMVRKGIASLTGKDKAQDSVGLFFTKDDIIGIKVNPVGPPLINTRLETIDAVVKWLVDGGIRSDHIVIWDRFDYMLKDAGVTPARFPGIGIEGLQTMDENEKGTAWRGPDGNHVSIDNFDKDVFYFAKGVVGKGVRGYPSDEFYLNQHVFNGEYSYFGKLVTQKLTKIINLAAYKNTGPSISMATKNIGYGALCNTGRLHGPLGLKLGTEVIGIPVVRDKLVLNVTDGIRGQYDGGPDKNEKFIYPNHSLYVATDPFALDTICHNEIVAKRKEMGATVNENPRVTEYLRYGETLGLGIADVAKITVVKS
jgi:hypothetical protein